MNRAEAELFLRELFSSTPAATDTLINIALDGARVVDSAGRAPSDPGYIETIDQWWAAAELAAILAVQQAQSGTVTEFSSEGSSFKTGGPNWWAVAAQYRQRSPLAGPGGVGVIEIDTGATFRPRSLREDPPC